MIFCRFGAFLFIRKKGSETSVNGGLGGGCGLLFFLVDVLPFVHGGKDVNFQKENACVAGILFLDKIYPII
ncbi:hypothetical protein QG039_10535 [Kingella kingae]|nr:hypothetical protein [Kingella kingae]MDK4539731.1 hypothetical protein [Kingella kingae]